MASEAPIELIDVRARTRTGILAAIDKATISSLDVPQRGWLASHHSATNTTVSPINLIYDGDLAGIMDSAGDCRQETRMAFLALPRYQLSRHK